MAFLSGLKLGAHIGSGHFGEVFLGTDDVHGQVAVKVLSRKPEDTDEKWGGHKTAFLTEAQNLSKATHRNVVQVHHIAESDDGNSVHICMAYCPGGSLQAAYEQGPSPLPAVRKIGTEVLFGLQALHARGLIHRDIKPGNILLDAQGIAQLGDFGFVTDAIIFGYASHAGYNDHLAHEVWLGRGTSKKSDIWALGMTLYRLLHGKIWYEESPTPRYVIRDGGFADSLKWLPHVPKKWRRTLRKMMSDNTDSRYQSTEQVLAAFSSLPTEPAWVPTVASDLIRWERNTKTRRLVVEWKRQPRHHEWRAWSEPLTTGRRMSLGGSASPLSGRQVRAELEQFFST